METDRPSPRLLPFERRTTPPLPSPFVYLVHGPVRVLDARRLEHRRRMLDHLQSQKPPRQVAS